ncbi:trypsin-like peptidase domain-containing protein [Spirochaeta cellobiosiphila]|uniref:trypsin-like peptidase domain-containing protein n=1 Tax=Spirochaeta cellobiosiphila TaxID=504483 RepID=UPI0004060012|nr:trypsin-like peptidase domain-containing protein [Spirochaeta cellobiosiphila]
MCFRKFLVLILGFLYLTFSLYAYDEIDINSTTDGLIGIGGEGNDYVTYIFEVTDSTFALQIKLNNSVADLDLYLRYGEDMMNYDDADARSAGIEYNESIFLSRTSDTPLQTGYYYLDVAQNNTGYPQKNGELWDQVPYTLNLRSYSQYNYSEVELNKVYNSSILRENGHFQVYKLELDSVQSYLRIDLLRSVADLDFFFQKDYPAIDAKDAAYSQKSLLAHEFLEIKDQDFLTPGSYYLTVYDPLNLNMDFPFALRIANDYSFITEDLPVLDTGAVTNINRAAEATVEISSNNSRGSGCLVSPMGFILTNYHVIKAPWGEPYKTFYISLNQNLSLPPVEQFQAVFVDGDEEKDIALLRITSDFYGQLLPSDYRFPYFTIGDSSQLELGNTLHLFGYPSIGGQGSRVSLTYTQGFVSGFEQTNYGQIIKTDGEISSGNSGGAATDDQFRLIGLPTTVVSEHSGRLAYIHPVNLIPQEWRRLWENFQ